jgi:hypothetical protein
MILMKTGMHYEPAAIYACVLYGPSRPVSPTNIRRSHAADEGHFGSNLAVTEFRLIYRCIGWKAVIGHAGPMTDLRHCRLAGAVSFPRRTTAYLRAVPDLSVTIGRSAVAECSYWSLILPSRPSMAVHRGNSKSRR